MPDVMFKDDNVKALFTGVLKRDQHTIEPKARELKVHQNSIGR